MRDDPSARRSEREEVSRQLRQVMTKAFRNTWQRHRAEDVSLRQACYLIGVERVARAIDLRGFLV